MTTVSHQNISQYQLGSVLDQLGFGTETKKRKHEITWNKQKWMQQNEKICNKMKNNATKWRKMSKHETNGSMQ